MDSKKISFGFSKLSKKPSIFSTKPQQQQKEVELIECLEGQSIKIKNAKDETKGPLVIPLNQPSNEIIDRIKESRAKRNETTKCEVDGRPDSELTLDELAARELLREAQSTDVSKIAKKVLELPIKKDEVILEGKEESTLDDYESVPISDYGMAMLRGMGWKEGMAIGKNQNFQKVQPKEPSLRPKGLGLGANKMANIEKKTKNDDEKELALVRGAFAKITAGHHKGFYCQVEGFDDEAGRVIVKLALKGTVLSLNEFLLLPVSKQEFEKSSKVINNAKYEQFKKSDTSSSSNRDRKRDEQDALDDNRRIKKEQDEEESRKNSSVDRDHRKHKKSSKKHKKRSKNDSSDENDEDKGRTRRKDRSRSRSRSRGRSSRKHKSKSKR